VTGHSQRGMYPHQLPQEILSINELIREIDNPDLQVPLLFAVAELAGNLAEECSHCQL